MSQNQNVNEEETLEAKFASIYLSDIIKGFFKFWWLIVVFAVIFGSFNTYSNKKNYVPRYTATVTLLVKTASSSSMSGISNYSFYSDTATATKLADAFPYLLSSNLLQDAICESLGIDYIRGSLSASSIPGTNDFTISFTGYDPQETYDILCAAVDKYPMIAKDVIGDLQFKILANPSVPSSPSNKISYTDTFINGALIGIVLGLACILAYAILRKTIRSRADIKKNFNLETIGTLPQVSFKKHNIEVDNSILMTNERIGNGFLESLRVFKNTFVNSLDKDDKVILLTSTAPGEGKSTVCANLALSLTQSGSKVLIIDGDLRNPSIKPLFMLDDESLECEALTDWYIITHLKKYDVSIMTLEEENKKYWKMMKTGFFKKIFDEVRDNYDYILVDTPPCGLVSDAMAIAQSCDAVLYVILQDTIRTSKIRAGLESLLSTDTKVLGCVLNGALSGSIGYGSDYGYSRYGYGYYGHKYGYGSYGKYGYGYGEKKKRKTKRNDKTDS